MHGMRFTVVLDPQPEGGFTAQCVEIPGAVSEGDTEQEALQNVQDAIREILGVRRTEWQGHRLATVDVDV